MMIRKLGEEADNLGKDKQGNDRTIYDVGWGTLVGRNFVAGMSRALGGLFFNLILLVILGSFLAKYVWPQLQGPYQTILEASKMLSKASQTSFSDGEGGVLPLLGKTVRFDIKQVGESGSETKSVELSPEELGRLLLQKKN